MPLSNANWSNCWFFSVQYVWTLSDTNARATLTPPSYISKEQLSRSSNHESFLSIVYNSKVCYWIVYNSIYIIIQIYTNKYMRYMLLGLCKGTIATQLLYNNLPTWFSADTIQFEVYICKHNTVLWPYYKHSTHSIVWAFKTIKPTQAYTYIFQLTSVNCACRHLYAWQQNYIC